MRITCAAAAVALIAAGCSSGDSKAPAESADRGPVTVAGIEFPAPELTTVKIGVTGSDVGLLPLYMIENQKLAEQFGIDLQVNTFSGTAQATQALLAGQVDVLDASGGVAMSTQPTERPARIAFINSDRLDDLLISTPNVTSADQLRGKAVAISSFGSQSNAGALVSLKSMGLSGSDVTLTPVGNDAARLAALRAGSVDAAVLSVAVQQALTDAGFHVLKNMVDITDAGYITTSLTMPEAFTKKNPNTALALTAIYQMGKLDSINKPEQAAEYWAKIAEIPADRAKIEVDAFEATDQHPVDGKCDPAVMALIKDVSVAANPKLESVDPAAACTNEYIDKLGQMGFQAALGVPGY
jgi:ABC-type nitrate/sulfonate/bicarbonate transport system substrate-binding protein